MFEDAESYKTLCLSTAHVSDDDRKLLEQYSEKGEYTSITSKEGGWFVWTGIGLDIEEHRSIFPGLSEGFIALAKQASSEGFRYIDFDRDAPEVEGLPRFDW